MDDATLLMLKSEIQSIVCKAEAVIKDHGVETFTVYWAIEEVSVLLPKSDGKQSSVTLCTHPEQARTVFVREFYNSFGEYFIENFRGKWLQSEYDDIDNRMIVLFDKYFVDGPDEESFGLLYHAISVVQLHTLRNHSVQLLESLLKKNLIMRILEKYCCGQVSHLLHGPGLSEKELVRLPQWQTLLTIVCSLPDVVLAKASGLESGTFFFPQNYVSYISSEIIRVLQTVYARLQTGVDSSVLFLALLIGKISMCGYSEILLKNLVPELERLCSADFLWRRIAQGLFSRISDRCLESVVVQLVILVSSPNMLAIFLGNMPQASLKLRYIVSHKLLLVRCFDGAIAVHVLRNIIGYLASSTELSGLYICTFQSLLSTWADASSLRHRPLEQSVYLSKAIVAFITYSSPQVIIKIREDITRYMLDGLPNYLGSSVATLRQIGAVVAEKLSDATRSENESDKLHFDIEKNEIIDSILELCNLPNNEAISTIDKQDKVVDDGSEVVSETFNNLSIQVHNEVTALSASQSKENMDSDDDTDLKPYRVFASEPENSKKPVYLAQCIDGLIKQDDPESVEQSLIHAEALVKCANVGTVHEVGIELCRILLHLSDQFAIASFTIIRFRAMVALVVTAPALIAEYLGTEFYARNYNIRQRMDILYVLASGATELAEPPKPASSSQTVPASSCLPLVKQDNTQSNWSDVIRERIESKTRRFGKGRQGPVLVPTANRFAAVAGSFFYPLLQHFGRHEDSCLDLLGTDHLVFERLIYTLGSVMLAATGTQSADKMARTLIEFLMCSRHHVEVGVRRANLYAVCTCLAAMPKITVLDDPVVFNDLCDWLQHVLQQDPDVDCRERASQALQLMNAAVQQVFA